ncbi:MAG TPA: hypothetical protein IGS40_04080 [Trichormus sp. M33_DOE_039]|nr:hypothetical protein [Trichormus sp. M33_DOE_039]
MQIDFHHGVTYVVARLAGFEHEAASIIAYSAQYVDDATNDGLIRFDNGALFQRMSSAHKMLDYRNFEELANYRVWIPFHFLPGNGGLPAGQDPQGNFIDKLICRPNSYVAQEMVRECIEQRHRPYALHRLGITMHVYVDTWAHQGFAGVNHQVNEAKQLVDGDGKPDRNLIERLQNYFISEALPLGHGSVLSNPDKPFLSWGYTNGRGEKITRNNPQDFLTAADHMCRAMQRYLVGKADATVSGLPAADKSLIASMLQSITDIKGGDRHQKWLRAIADGKFSFGAADVSYIEKGRGSWKYLALGTDRDKDKADEKFLYRPSFLNSNWKLFHDALESHHFYIIHDLLPKYGICVA